MESEENENKGNNWVIIGENESVLFLRVMKILKWLIIWTSWVLEADTTASLSTNPVFFSAQRQQQLPISVFVACYMLADDLKSY